MIAVARFGGGDEFGGKAKWRERPGGKPTEAIHPVAIFRPTILSDHLPEQIEGIGEEGLKTRLDGHHGRSFAETWVCGHRICKVHLMNTGGRICRPAIEGAPEMIRQRSGEIPNHGYNHMPPSA
jgi:hypothetical protein